MKRYLLRSTSKRRNIIGSSLLLGCLVSAGVAYGHGTNGHHQVDAQMKKLHEMMPIFSVATSHMEAALEKGDAGAFQVEAERITAALPDLKKSRPHKNSSQKKKFVQLTDKLGVAVGTTVELTKKGDLAGAKVTFKKVEQACAACHTLFRE